MSGADSENSTRRVAIIVVSAFLLVSLVVAVTVGVTWQQIESEENQEGDKSVSNKQKAVKSICAPTDYKKECEETLEAEGGDTSDPKQLIMVTFNATIKKIESALEKSHTLHEAENDPRAKQALDSCKDLMQLSIDEFTRSLYSINSFDFNNIDKILMNLKVWLSGAITYQDTCIQGFENTTSPAGQKMKELLENAMHMSSNGLAIINDMANALASLNLTKQSRRLLHHEDDLTHAGDATVLRHGVHHNLQLPFWMEEDGMGARRGLLEGDKHIKEGKLKPDVVVAKDGSGKFKSINEALNQVPKKNKKPFVIYIKEGVYKEYVHIKKDMTYVVLIGDGGNKTRITGNKNFKDGTNTYNTCTVAVQGDHFLAIKMGFENSAGAEKHQAVALRVQADLSIFYKCQIDGYQDTLYAHALRQFYRDCTISGTIDFIFGDAVSVFQNCTFVVRKPMENQQCIVTAQGRKERHQPSAIVIQGGSIVADKKYYPVRFKNKAYLARPWKLYSRTIIMEAYLDDLIQPEGFLGWDTLGTGEKTCFYAEYNNKGPGSDVSKRVKWNGIKHITPQHATDFSPLRYFKNDLWIRETRIPYNPGMLSTK
ncbi:putative pectinesterase/pectinesterase inhibitor 28 [Senna tora]|uniref:Pectinesterase n=1 Tax=Senna tora TaxID=362788 RepID=A0A834SWX7_9FABA|nr:putative pectinesterase/pectinesterase inhibitor 28 [Senna tora]